MSENELKLLLLDILFPARQVSGEQLRALPVDAWEGIKIWLQEHRLGPLFCHALKHKGLQAAVPAELWSWAEAAFKRGALRALALQRELLLVDRILTEADIPYVALKGACLAYYHYPVPGLRPLRDIDLLVPREQLLSAYQVLQSAGLRRVDGQAGDPGAAALVSHHLPALLSPGASTVVELHGYLFHQSVTADGDLAEDQAFWTRCSSRVMAGKTIRFESPTDLLFHMVIHAAYDHYFNNGPLLITDIGYLLQAEEIDWPLFWNLARQRGYIPGCVLAFKLVEYYWGPLAASYPEESKFIVVNEQLLASVAILMLVSRDSTSYVLFETRADSRQSWRGWLSAVRRRLFPPVTHIAARFPVKADSWKVFCYYPAWWWHVARLLPGYFAFILSRQYDSNTLSPAELRTWLEADLP